METAELLKKVRKIEIRTKGLVNQIFSGEYHSVFKGRGMAFSEVREYQFGDDIRTIDWNVSARFNHPFVKVFEEERELTVMLLVDVSGSGEREVSDLGLELMARSVGRTGVGERDREMRIRGESARERQCLEQTAQVRAPRRHPGQ